MQVQNNGDLERFGREYGLRNLTDLQNELGDRLGFFFQASARSLFTCFSSLAYNKHIAFSIRNPKHLSERCKQKTQEILQHQGWERSAQPEIVLQGERFYRWTKDLTPKKSD